MLGVVFASTRSGGPGPFPLALPAAGGPASSGDPFAYHPSHRADFEQRATAGSAHVLFAKSPGGGLATAGRVSAFRSMIQAARAGSGVDARTLEAIVFLESAGRPEALAGSDPSGAAGLTQILAQTGQSLLGMHIDLTQSRRLTRAIDRAYALGQSPQIRLLLRERARVDDRFDPRKALAATVRYLELARRRFGRTDLAVVSYHMGIGNLQNLLNDYDGGRAVPYAQLYFDTAPDHHASAFRLLHGLGDDSSLYYWRVLGAAEILRLMHTDRPALMRLSALQSARDSNEAVLHPPDRTQAFSDPDALRSAFASRSVLPLPSDPGKLGLSYDAGIGSLAPRLMQPPALYRGLRPAALDLLIELASRVRLLSGGALALRLTSCVRDVSYQRLLGSSDPEAAARGYSLHTTGFAFDIARRYTSRSQAVAFQAVLDRLQALNLIAWAREPAAIHIAVAGDASRAIRSGLQAVGASEVGRVDRAGAYAARRSTALLAIPVVSLP